MYEMVVIVVVSVVVPVIVIVVAAAVSIAIAVVVGDLYGSFLDPPSPGPQNDENWRVHKIIKKRSP